jgi:hypothetical protein
MEIVEPDGLDNFNGSCPCGAWVEFSRRRSSPKNPREQPLTREEVEAMGFVMANSPPIR